MAAELDQPARIRAVLDDVVGKFALNSGDLPVAVRDVVDDVRAAVNENLDAAATFDSEMAELNDKRDLLPAAGFSRLQREAAERARDRHKVADRQLEQLLKRLDTELENAALPRLDPKREALARQELALVVGEAKGGDARSRILNLAQAGSREAQAALLTSFGTSLLEGRGVSGKDLQDTLGRARRTIAATAAERGETEREIIAARAIIGRASGGLGAARGFSGAQVVKRTGPIVGE